MSEPAERAALSSRLPGPVDVLVLFASVLAYSALTRAAFGAWLWLDLGTTLVFAAASAAMTGLPALAWALDRGRGSAAAMLGAGGLAGAVPPLILLASGTLRLSVVAGLDTVHAALAQGAIIPGRGLQSWTQFTAMTGVSVLIGLASGATLWLAARRVLPNRRY
jgi:hypothetical protein